MDKGRFTDDCIQDMKRLVDSITTDNLDEVERQLSTYFQAIRSIEMLPDLNPVVLETMQAQELNHDIPDSPTPIAIPRGRIKKRKDKAKVVPNSLVVEGLEQRQSALPDAKTDDTETVVQDVHVEPVCESAGEVIEDFPDINFEERTILVVGLSPRRAVYQERIEQLGGKFLHADGTEKEQRLQGLVQKSDVVVMIRSHVSHRASFAVSRLCKEHGVKLVTTASRGIKSVIQSAAIRLGLIEEEADNAISDCSVSRISNRMLG